VALFYVFAFILLLLLNMGTCTNMCQTDVEFEQIDMKISKKNV